MPPTFDRPRGEKPPGPEQKIVFEEVADEGVEDFTYKEDLVETMAGNVLGLEKRVAAAQKQGKSGEVEASQLLLAKARYEQAAYNEKNGRGKEGEADRLLKEWQAAQDRYDVLRSEQIDRAHIVALGLFDKRGVGADSADQLRRHA